MRTERGRAGEADYSTECWPPQPPKDILDYLEFDLKYRVKGAKDWTVVFPQDKPVPIKDIKCKKIGIGSLPSEVEVCMSFHLRDNTPIELGGKVVTALFEFILEQESNPT